MVWLSVLSLCLSVFFFYRWCELWKAFEDLSIEYGRLWNECKRKHSGFEKFLHDWVRENYGREEASNPSWNIEELAKDLERKVNE